MSIKPCGDHTQLCSTLLVFRYFPSATSVSHSTREKLIRHRSPSFGGSGVTFVFTISCSPFHGHLISSVHPLSVSRGSLRVPSRRTAVFSPVISHAWTACPPSLYGFVSSKSQVVLNRFNSNSPYM